MTANLTQRIQDIKQGVGRPEDILAIERLAVGKMRDASLPRNIRALHVAARSGAFEHYAVATVVTGKGSGGGKPQYHMNLYSHEVADVIVVCYANDLLSKGASVQREFLGVTNARMARLDEVEKRADRSVLDTFLILRPQLEALDDWKRQTRRTRLTERSQAAWEAVSGKGKLRR